MAAQAWAAIPSIMIIRMMIQSPMFRYFRVLSCQARLNDTFKLQGKMLTVTVTR